MNPPDLSLVAFLTCRELLEQGLKQGHHAESWRDEPQDNHLDKAVRHIMTYKLIRDGNQIPDNESCHLKNALCRIAMALCQEIEKG